ncbi:signal recognition particle [Candidatus Phycorickettsia trachydisci]|uniref:Signal recognition particle protein n=1 Tax=Candidatus Phycorickettsia trachydisci TaxID=2115978 RepID=A0A2P1P7F7_9RICK|nr:signal recognition particle protein [Candidatus Phycorickettsia trachydisci]AVP87201.1 signal recognition particle [Candidatus Phycorickettsia trachydisci]
MFESLASSFNKILNKIAGIKKISSQDLDITLGEIKAILIDADVAVSVVDDFIVKVRSKALGQEVLKSLTPGQMIVKIINDELIKLLSSDEGEGDEGGIKLKSNKLNTVLMLGLQGSGKTTTSAKLASWFKKQLKKVLLISTDVYRPAAREQLATLGQSLGVDFFSSNSNDPIEIAKSGLKYAQDKGYDVAIFDTAGRLQIDERMIQEARSIKEICQPQETLLVVDSLSGQSAAAVAKKFHEELNISGSLLTRIDADNKGGAALSIKAITGQPIKFLGTGEKTDALEPFEPKKIAERILGMGDLQALVKEAEKVIDKEKAEEAAKKIQSGKFDLDDYLDQIKNLSKMGGLSKIMKFMPAGISGMQNRMKSLGFDDDSLKKQEAIICSMTKKERRDPERITMSRKKRIAQGAGVKVSDVDNLLKHFAKIQDTVKKASKINFSEAASKMGLNKFF